MNEPEAPTDNSAEFVELHVTAAPEDATETLEVTPVETPEGEPAEGEKPDAERDADDKAEGDPDDGRLRHPDGTFRRDADAKIHRATFLRREAERQRDAAIAQLQRAQVGDDAAPKSKPTADQYEDYGDYVEALTDWKVADRERSNADSNADTAAKAVETHRAAEWSAKIGAAKTSLADFDAVMDKADTPTLPHVANAIMDADRGPELLYHLAQNPEIVERLNDMSPNRAAMELGRIEATLEAPAEAPKPRETKTSKAPAPITPVPPSSSASKDPSKMSMDEYTKFRKNEGVI